MIFVVVKKKKKKKIWLGRSSVPTTFNDDYDFKIGKGVILREGIDATIIACGIMVDEAVKACLSLKSEGISTRVINLSTIKTIDEELIIESVLKTGAIVTVEEHSVIGGLGSAVSEVVAEECPVIVKK